VCEVEALVDTGAARTIIPHRIASQLGLGIVDYVTVRFADGRSGQVGMTDPVRVHLEGRHTAEETLVVGDEVLIGQTILEKLDLFVASHGRRLIPNPDHPDKIIARL
jgi:clan AA aspartic protease